ncbi:hypothetical protein Y032_0986g3296 [Ancylostoma ceylanicum]|uniref:Uncharacterized protein n=1 Tax=Ancylostoma ceylanicum TaxID=53326 RepID=A0A016W9R4_9BILA|nr:hypothetical protein Y032_0986g3296 [Ancylostoma ceylanicum]
MQDSRDYLSLEVYLIIISVILIIFALFSFFGDGISKGIAVFKLLLSILFAAVVAFAVVRKNARAMGIVMILMLVVAMVDIVNVFVSLLGKSNAGQAFFAILFSLVRIAYIIHLFFVANKYSLFFGLPKGTIANPTKVVPRLQFYNPLTKHSKLAPTLEQKMWKFCLTIAAFISYGNARLGCKNMNGEDVDWFAAIKLPPGVDERKGKSFVYFDSTQDGWEMSPEAIDSNKSAIGATINQIYGIDKMRTFTIAYNDDSPVKAVDSNRGHSKGVAAFDNDVGFWMVHSIPNFPPLKKYDYPKSGTRFAQSLLCLSLSTNALEDVGQYMRFAQVTPFLSNLPDSFKVVAPSLVDVVNKKSLSNSDTIFTTIRGLETLDGKRARGFSKHKKFGADLWYDFIAPNLKTPMAVETWRSGSGKDVGTKCGKKENVYDVNTVNILGKTFLNTNDHSKWGVSMNRDVPAVCIGDVNRQRSQYKRGGGAVCIEDVKLWETFHGSVGDYNGCRVRP